MRIVTDPVHQRIAQGILPTKADLAELTRPWKLISFAVGMCWLLVGALNYHVADWDVGVSPLMGGLTYLCAPWSVGMIFAAVQEREPGWLLRVLAALVMAWFVVDGSYVLYHTLIGNRTFRLENFYASSTLYFLAGVIWVYRGTLRALLDDVRRAIRNTVQP